jgi:hypothetical protein
MKKKWILLITFSSLFIIAYFTTDQWLDPDFGWHLKTGELILKRGVPKIDWYSFTMSNFPWIDHEWLTEVFIYKIYSFFGFKFLLVIFLLISIFSFFLQLKFDKFFYFIFLILFGYLSCLSYLGVRPQIITWLLFSIFLKILNSMLNEKKYKCVFIFPILFSIWANLHGGFFVGIFTLFLILFLKISERDYLSVFYFILAIFLSFLATLFNPYGIKIYEEIFRTITDKNLIFTIKEWMPLFFADFSIFKLLFIVLFLTLSFTFIKIKEIHFKDLTLPFTFLIFSILHTRHFPLFAIVTLSPLADLLIKARKKVQPFENKIFSLKDKKTYLIFGSLLFLIALQLFFFLSPSNKGMIYPSLETISFLKNLPVTENMFNPYGWGGYLIWKLPERKVFIDGRMPSWRMDGKYILEDYLRVKNAKENFQEILKKYDIKIILLEKWEKEQFEPNGKIENFLMERIFKFFKIKKRENLYQKLTKSGWQEIFEDETAIILKKYDRN